LRKTVVIGVSGALQAGLLPLGIGLGGGISGGQGIGLSIPDDWKNWKCYQLVWQSNVLAGLGVGSFAGVGVGVSASSTSNDAPLPSFSTSHSMSSNTNAGLGVSGGFSFGSDGTDAFTEGSLSGGKVGIGFGLSSHVGLNTTTTKVLIDTIGDECGCQ